MNALLQERHKHSESCITVEVFARTQKVETNLANERSGLALFSTDLGHIFGSNVGNEFGVMFSKKGPHKTEIAYDIVRIHPLVINTRTRLCKLSLATRRRHCCVVFSLFQSSRLETL